MRASPSPPYPSTHVIVVSDFDGTLATCTTLRPPSSESPSGNLSAEELDALSHGESSAISGDELEDEDEEMEIGALRSRMLDIETALLLNKPRKSVRSSFDQSRLERTDSASRHTEQVHVKTKEDRESLFLALDKIFLFSHLQPEQREQLVDAFAPVSVQKGDSIIVEGDSENVQHLYVITQGACRVSKTQSNGVEEVVHTCRELECFGELALMYNCPRAATVTVAVEDAKLFSLCRDSFQYIVHSAGHRDRELYDQFMSRVGVLASLTKHQRSKIADVLKTKTFRAGEHMIQEGNTAADTFFIVFSGVAVASKHGVGVVKEYATGDCFGELALIMDRPRAATVTAKGPGDCTCVCIDRFSSRPLVPLLASFLPPYPFLSGDSMRQGSRALSRMHVPGTNTVL